MIKIVVIGLGRIGSEYPTAKGGVPRNHIEAILQRDDMNVTTIVDCRSAAIEKVIKNRPALQDAEKYCSIEDIPVGGFDVAILCTPPQNRLQEIRQLCEKKPRLLIVEKPVALDAKSAHHIALLAQEYKIMVRVNFHRRFDLGYVKFKNELRESSLTAPKKIIMRYNKGLFNYAPHLLDQLLDWYGAVINVLCIDLEEVENPSFVCHLESGLEAIFLGMNDLEYDQCEVELLFDHKKYELANGGCEKFTQVAVEDLFYSHYTQLSQRSYFDTPGPVGGLAELYEAISACLIKRIKLGGCNINEACSGLSVLEAVMSSRNDGLRKKPVSFKTLNLI